MLISLKLKNFKQHSLAEIDFASGINTITGENFAGKSSLLHALLYAWWGALAVPGGQKIVQKRGTTGHSVEVVWTMGDDTYHIQRTSSLCNLWKNGTDDEHLEATSSSAVGIKLVEIFGMDRAEFCDIKYSEQKRSEQMLTIGSGRVHSLIEKIVDAERVNNVIDLTKKEVQRVDILLTSVPSFDMPELLAFKERYDKDMVTNKEKAAESEIAYSKSDVELREAAEQLQALNTKSAVSYQAISQYHQLSSSLKNTEASLGETRAKFEARPKFTDGAQLDKGIAALKQRISGGELEIAAWNTYDSDSFIANETLNAHTETLRAAKEALVNAVKVPKGAASQGGIASLQAKFTTQHEETRDALTIANNLLSQLIESEHSAFCHACKRPFEGKDATKIRAQIADQKTKVSKLDTLVAEVADELKAVNELESVYENITSLEFAVQQAESNADEASATLKAIKKPNGTKPSVVLAAQLQDQLEAQVQEKNDAAIEEVTLDNLRENISRLIKEQTDYALQMTKLVETSGITNSQLEPGAPAPFKEEISLIQNKVRNLEEINRANATANSSAKEAIAGLREKIANISEKILNAKKVEDEKKALIVRRDLCKRLNKFLRDNKDTFLAEVWQRVMGYATAVAQSCTGGKISEVNRTTDGKFEYWEDGEVFPVEAASGAQRSIMGLGVQLALSEMLPSQFGALLLDEPTADMSETVSMSLATLLSKSGSQVLMVSHRELDGTVSDNAIHM